MLNIAFKRDNIIYFPPLCRTDVLLPNGPDERSAWAA